MTSGATLTGRILWQPIDIARLGPRWAVRAQEVAGATICAGPLFQGALGALSPGTPQRVAVVEDSAGDLLAVWPLARIPIAVGPMTLQEIGFPRNPHTLRNSLLTPARRDVIGCLLRTVLDGTRSDTLLLQNMQGSDDVLDQIRDIAPTLGVSTGQLRPGRQFDIADMSMGFDSYLATRSGQFRRQLRKRTRELEQMGRFRIRMLTGGQLVDHFGAWKRVVAASWQGDEHKGEALCDAEWDFHRHLAGNGALWLAFLDDHPIAALRMLEHARAVHLHMMHFDQAFRQQAPGVVLFGSMMREAADRGVTRVDFNGQSGFFDRWSTGQTPSQTLRLFRPTLRGTGAKLVERWRPAQG